MSPERLLIILKLVEMVAIVMVAGKNWRDCMILVVV